jgi:threonine dehydratase
MDEAGKSSYDPSLTTDISTPPDPLSAIRDAAGAVYGAAIRTPLIRVDLPAATGSAELYLKLECLQPIGSFKIRGAYNVVRQLTPAQLRDGVWTVSAGNAAQGVAFAARKAGARCSVMVRETRPYEDSRDRTARLHRPATYDECWKTVEAHGSDRMTGHFCIRSTTAVSSQANDGRPQSWKTCPTWTRSVAPLGRRRTLSGLAAAVRQLKPDTRVYAAEPESRRAPLAASLASGPPGLFRQLEGVVRGRRRQPVGAHSHVAAARAALGLHRRLAGRGGAGHGSWRSVRG